MGNYSNYYKDIENSTPMKSIDNLTKQRQLLFEPYIKSLSMNCDLFCEYGCGPGTNVKYLLKFAKKVDCFDIEEVLRPWVEKEGAQYHILRDEGETTGKESEIYDAIYSTDVLEHIYWPRTAVKEMYRILKKNCYAYITVPYHGILKNLVIAMTNYNSHYSPDNPHVRFFTTKTLCDLFKSEGFIIEKVLYLGRIKGLSKNICLIAKKGS